MSEMNKPDIQSEELNIASAPEQAVDAATTNLAEEQSNEQPVGETTEETLDSVETVNANAGSKPATRMGIIERLLVIAEDDDVLGSRTEVEALKVQFYKLRTSEIEAERKEFVENGGNENLFIPGPDTMEEQFKAVLNTIKEKKNARLKAQEEEMQANYEAKLALIEKLRLLIDKASQGAPEVNEFRALQAEWKEIKKIPQDKETHLWKEYQQLVEQFYDVLKLNHEFREYDFKKNLESKNAICKAAEELTTNEDIIDAFRQLQQLHIEFREIGPVAPELREQVWLRFKNASTIINRRHQEYFEEKKKREIANLELKTAICEEIESMELDALTSYQAWNNATQKVLDMQARWKEIGFAPQKMNLRIFERFRVACDEFFNRKSEYYKNAKAVIVQNLEKKQALCEQAEALKDSEEWKETAEKLSALQKEWKTVGPVPQKQSDVLWKRFVSACDEFFERRKKATSSQRSVEQENLKLKTDVIAKIKEIDVALSNEEQTKILNALVAEWNSIGFVPYKEKDRLYKEYRSVVDAVYERLHIQATERRLADFRNNISKGGNALQRERERLIRQYENFKNEISTYENNLGFLSTSNKKGESLVNVIRQKMEKLKDEAQVILKKIHLIEEELEKQ